MKKLLVVLISVSGIIWVCGPSLAQNSEEEKGVLYPTDRAAENLTGAIPCDAQTHPILYYVPVDEMQCEIPGGYGIDFEGTLELEEKERPTPVEDTLRLLAIY